MFKDGRPVGIHVKHLANGEVKHIKFKWYLFFLYI
jgi:hypothetical protein